MEGGKMGTIPPEEIYTNDKLYSALSLYFHDELDDPIFQKDHEWEIAENPRWTYARYMAACIPFHEDCVKLVRTHLSRLLLPFPRRGKVK